MSINIIIMQYLVLKKEDSHSSAAPEIEAIEEQMSQLHTTETKWELDDLEYSTASVQRSPPTGYSKLCALCLEYQKSGTFLDF